MRTVIVIALCAFAASAYAQQPPISEARFFAMQAKLNDELNVELQLREAMYNLQKIDADLLKQWDQESDDEQDSDGQSK